MGRGVVDHAHVQDFVIKQMATAATKAIGMFANENRDTQISCEDKGNRLECMLIFS